MGDPGLSTSRGQWRMSERARTRRRGRRETVWVVLMAGGAASVAFGTLPSTILDFFLRGSQPGVLVDPMASVQECMICHGGFDVAKEPYRPWAASMMGQAARDP